MRTAHKRVLQQLGIYFLAWTALGLFFFSQGIVQKRFSGDPTPWQHHLTSWMVGVYLWFLLTPLILWLGRRFPIERNRWIRRAALHLILSVGVAICQLAVESIILRSLRVFPTIMVSVPATLFFLLIIEFHQGVITYWMLLGVQYAIGYYQRYQERRQEALRLELRSSELQAQLMQAHLRTLKMQLQPHFLFNTLNAIMVLVRQQKSREAEEMLARLSDLLRCVLEEVETQEVPLRRELDYLQLYLSIEQVRFQDRLRVEVAVDPETLEAAVPHMGLQPLVENAVRHGIARSSSAGRIRISACRVHQTLELRVEDDGPGLEISDPNRGIGLANTRARLGRLYGDCGRLVVENGASGGVTATMSLPFHAAPGGSETELMDTHALHGVAG